MLYREIIALCPELHTRHINTVCVQNVEFVNVRRGGTYSIHWALEGEISITDLFYFYQLSLLVTIQILF
jgi:hypothetical protein